MRKFLIILVFILSSCSQKMAQVQLLGEKSYSWDSQEWMDKANEQKALDIQKQDNKYIIVKKGDNLYNLALENDIYFKELANANDLKWPYKLYDGQKLFLPKDNINLAGNDNAKNYDTNKANSKNSIEPNANKIISNSQLNKDSSNKIKTVQIINPRTKFSWPAKGKVISSFGIKPGGIKNDGINIALPMNTPIKSTYQGKIIYTGDELTRYGNLVIIQHGKDWYSAYAHLNRIIVNRAQDVKANQIIGYAGDTGKVSTPQVHFALRYGKKPVDPLKYLP